MLKKLLVACIFFNMISTYAQENIDALKEYKYVVIPMKYEFQSKENQYLLNSLTKHLLNENGFKTLMSVEEKPKDLLKNNCLALYADIESLSEGFMSMGTKLNFQLKDCYDNIVYTARGYSRIKDYKESFQAALREAFKKGFENYRHTYTISDSVEMTAGISETTKVKQTENLNSENVLDGLEGYYKLFNNEFVLEKKEKGYYLNDKNSGENEAFLIKNSQDIFLFYGNGMNGTAIVDNENNLIVEYFDKDTQSLQKVTLYRLNQ